MICSSSVLVGNLCKYHLPFLKHPWSKRSSTLTASSLMGSRDTNNFRNNPHFPSCRTTSGQFVVCLHPPDACRYDSLWSEQTIRFNLFVFFATSGMNGWNVFQPYKRRHVFLTVDSFLFFLFFMLFILLNEEKECMKRLWPI